MKRLLWLGIGIAVGAVVVQQVNKTMKAYSPSGLAGSARNSAAGLIDAVRDFVADVREGMAEREAEIHAAFEHGVSLQDLDDLGDVAAPHNEDVDDEDLQDPDEEDEVRR